MTYSFFEADQAWAERQLQSELQHYGVKGMKWGVRKRERPSFPPSDDAVKVNESRNKARVSSTDALSTKELQQLVNRMNLEQQYARLSTPQKSAGSKFVSRMMKDKGFRDRNVALVTTSAGALAVKGALGLRRDLKNVNLSKVY